MENEQLIGTLRSLADILKNERRECTAAVVKLAAERLETLESYNENLRSANAHVLGTLQDEIEKAKAEAAEDTAREIFGELESLLKTYVLPVAKIGVIEIVKEPFLFIEPSDYDALKKRYTEGEQ